MKNKKRLSALLLLPVIGALAFTSFQQMTASVVNSQTQLFFDFWNDELKENPAEFQLQEQALQTVRDGANRAIAFAPLSPDYLVARGKVEDWAVTEAQRKGVAPDTVTQQEGLQAYREAILKRPAWPYAWADFAMAKARANEIDQEFFQALERATDLGPWEQQVMDTVTLLGLWYRDWLPQESLLAVTANLVRYAKTYPAQAMAIARTQNKTSLVCPLLDHPERFKKECDKQI